MDFLDTEIEINKNDVPMSDYFRGTYFENVKNTAIGSDKCTLTVAETSLLALPHLDLASMIDRCAMDPRELVNLFSEMLYKIDSTVIPWNIMPNKRLKMELVKNKIESSEYCDFGEIYQFILENPELMKITDKSGNNVLLWANINNHHCAMTLLADYPSMCFVETSNMLLWHAHPQIALKLLEEFPDKCDFEYIEQELNPLMLHVARGNEDVVTKIITKFSDKCHPEYINIHGKNALIIASHGLQKIAIKLLDAFPEIYHIWIEAYGRLLVNVCAYRNDGLAIKLLREFPDICDLETCDEYGRNALMYACKYIAMKDVAVEILTNFREFVDIDCISLYGETALTNAMHCGMSEVVVRVAR